MVGKGGCLEACLEGSQEKIDGAKSYPERLQADIPSEDDEERCIPQQGWYCDIATNPKFRIHLVVICCAIVIL